MWQAGILRSTQTILCTVEDTKHPNFVDRHIDLINNEIGRSADDPFARPANIARPAHVRKFNQQARRSSDFGNDTLCSGWISFGNKIVNGLEVSSGGGAVAQPHR